MSKKIQTYNDLLEEKKRLETLLPVHKNRLVNDWAEVKSEFAPVQNVFQTAGKFFKRDRSNPLVNMGIDFAGDMFLRKMLLAKADWVTRLFLPIFLKNYSSHLFTGPDGNQTLFGKIRSIFRRKHVHPEPAAFTPESMPSETSNF